MYTHALRIRPVVASSSRLHSLPFRFTDNRALRMHFECASFDLNSCIYVMPAVRECTRFAIIFMAQKCTKAENICPKLANCPPYECLPNRQKKLRCVRNGGGGRWGWVVQLWRIYSASSVIRYNYIYGYGSTQYINIFAIGYSKNHLAFCCCCRCCRCRC